jgi:hypothetical protein
MAHDATSLTHFDTPTALTLEVTFDGGALTTDGGLPLLARVDSELGLCESLADRVPEWRGSGVRHSLEDLVRQRVFQIACGYEDHNDADFLRTAIHSSSSPAGACPRRDSTWPASLPFRG